MKIRLNKESLSQMDERVRAIVADWKNQYRKSFITVENCDGFYADEDAKVTLINILTNKIVSAQVAGDFAGCTKLSPTAKIPVNIGVVAIVTGFFLGRPYLNIYQGSLPAIESGIEVAA
jgi:hypothetical protein